MNLIVAKCIIEGYREDKNNGQKVYFHKQFRQPI